MLIYKLFAPSFGLRDWFAVHINKFTDKLCTFGAHLRDSPELCQLTVPPHLRHLRVLLLR